MHHSWFVTSAYWFAKHSVICWVAKHCNQPDYETFLLFIFYYYLLLLFYYLFSSENPL